MRVLVILLLLLVPATAVAQTATTGAIQGVVVDVAIGEAMIGVTIVVSSPALEKVKAEITDENGFYKLTELPAGAYTVTVYYEQTRLDVLAVVVTVGDTTTVRIPFTVQPPVANVAVTPTISRRSVNPYDEDWCHYPIPGRDFRDAIGSPQSLRYVAERLRRDVPVLTPRRRGHVDVHSTALVTRLSGLMLR